MATEAGTLGTQRTIREYLNDTLRDQSGNEVGMQLKITKTAGSAPVSVYDVDLLWSGQEYLIAYRESETGYPIVRKLVDVLPISFIEIPVPATTS